LQLAAHGWDVINFDKIPSPDPNSGAFCFLTIELTDMGQVLEGLTEIDMRYKGVDAVVHLAALPAPGQTASSYQFHTNTMRYYYDSLYR